MAVSQLLGYLPWLIGGGLALGAGGIMASVHTTRLRIKNGYPLESMWGTAIKPEVTNEAQERIKLLSQENAALRAEISSVKDRLAVVERIVTDGSLKLGQDIEALRLTASKSN